MTLVALACSSPLEDGIVEQIEYLVKRQKADVTIKDANDNNAVGRSCVLLCRVCIQDASCFSKPECKIFSICSFTTLQQT